MASAAPEVAPTGWRAWLQLGTRAMVLSVWLPVALISVLHYATGPDVQWVHDVLRRLYYLPIIVAAFLGALRAGLTTAVVVTLAYLPHAFLHEHIHHVDPARSLEKLLELVLYLVVGGVAGYLAGLERTRRAQLQHALLEQQRLLKQLVRAGRLSALGEVVAGIAHEIKNPLHALAGTAEVVDPLIPHDAEERHLWELHRGEIERLKRIAERFLSFARPAQPGDERLDLREVAGRLVELVGAEARQKGVAIETALAAEPLWVRGDRDQLAQVGINIALNALRALAPGGGTLRVLVEPRTHEGEPMAALRLENNGPRLDEATIEHLFDPFATGHDDGTGLGLSISARIAELHRGYLEAGNEGLGVAFTLYVPLA